MKSIPAKSGPTTDLGSTSFYLSVSNQMPELVSMDGALRIPTGSLDPQALIKAKDLAHNQYVKAMMQQAEDLDVFRATLNFLCKAVERAGNPVARPHAPKAKVAPSRKMSPRKVRVAKQTQAA